jgi:peptidoglycan hydrolase CwlO-like protein
MEAEINELKAKVAKMEGEIKDLEESNDHLGSMSFEAQEEAETLKTHLAELEANLKGAEEKTREQS